MKTVIGITGGIACGKSTVSNFLKSLNYKIIDLDKVSREVVEVGKPAYNQIRDTFGESFFNSDKTINRRALNDLIFTYESERIKLNNIMFPILLEITKKQIDESEDDVIFLDAPLLYEAKFDYLCDYIICVYVDKNTQIDRLIKRNNVSMETAINAINSQMSLDKKCSLSNYIINNNGSFYDSEKQILEILDLIFTKKQYLN